MKILIIINYYAPYISGLTETARVLAESLAKDKKNKVTVLCSNHDKLTKNELKHICRDISRCLHRCEDLNIEAFNQYEKSIRYLRKSLNDAKTLYANWDKTSLEERGVYIERLNADLSKALIVAKEIESAKQLVDQYHFEANHHNYETLDDGKKKRK